MRSILTGCVTATTVFVVTLVGCKKEEPPAQNPQGWQQAQPGYQQPAAQPTAYPQAQPTAYPQAQPTAAPLPTAAPAAGSMNPNPTGLMCTTDAQCLTHKCNTQVGKCSYPCMSNADCVAGMVCMAPLCGPPLPGMVPPASAK